MTMASARKKLDEKHLKTLRELLSNPGNKHCFDCSQRGPTYVNVTIGSFVCTTCSGMLRGLTPPHRVKSISMAAFTQEEIDFISARGNEYCKKVWLGLRDAHNVPGGGATLGNKDEQALKDYMVSVYERKRYYVNPSDVERLNGTAKGVRSQPTSTVSSPTVQPPSTSFSSSNYNNNNNLRSHKNNNSILAPPTPIPPKPVSQDTDPFGSLNFVSSDAASSQTVDNFANFDNNPVFASSSQQSNQDVVDIGCSAVSDLSGIDFNPWGHSYQRLDPFLPPTSASNCSELTLADTSLNVTSPFQSIGSIFDCNMSTFEKVPPPPSEDRYAALKDLDSLMKSQLTSSDTPVPANSQQPEWGQPAWATNFDEAPLAAENNFEKSSNPFSTTTENGWARSSSFGMNPFQTEVNWPSSNGGVSNGLPVSQSLHFNQTKFVWDNNQTPNPFAMNGSGQLPNHHSSNPFL